MSRWRPTPEEERWLETAARLRGAISPGAIGERTGGWRGTGQFARVALFVLGVLAAALTIAVLGIGSKDALLASGVIAAVAAEWLKVSRRLQGSGIEEGLCTAAYLMIGIWIAGKTGSLLADARTDWLVVAAVVATAAAGLRLLNSGLTTCAALIAVGWFGSTQLARTIGGAAGGGMTAFVVAVAAAAVALLAGAREYRRPSRDQMLDGLVAALPVFAYQEHASWGVVSAASGAAEPVTVRLITVILLLSFGAASLAAGLRRRRHAPIIAFLGCVACLAIELARATAWPVEYWLALYGAVAIGVAAAVERRFRQPRGGITSTRLTDREGPLDLLQTVGAAVLAQRAGSGPAPEEPPAPPNDGRFGGGGASGRF